MTCDRFREAVVTLDEPSGALTTHVDLGGHVASCGECQQWFERYVTGAAQSIGDRCADVTAAVLARTTGSACEGARVLIASAADGDVARDDGTLLRAHLDRCDECRVFQAALAAVLPALRALDVLEPDAAFVNDVLARTSRRPRTAAWFVHMQVAWQGMVQRPRFALEAAYVCTLCWLLVFGQPMAAFDWTTARVNAVAQAAAIRTGPMIAMRGSVLALPGRADVVQAAERLVSGRRESVSDVAQSVWQRAERWTVGHVSRVVDALTSMWQSVVAWVGDPFVPAPSGRATHRTEPPAAAAR